VILPVSESEDGGVAIAGNLNESACKAYPQSSKAVGRARRDVVAFAKCCGFSGQLLDDIEAAVGEGLANAVEHGHRDEGSFEVVVRCNTDALIVEIKDDGGGFDHGAVCSHGRPPVEALRGFGTFIMRELMDGVYYSEFGTRLQLLKRLPPPGTKERRSGRLKIDAGLAVSATQGRARPK
jgi:anti-sigma regulatory factor (Ser/Thr protein kinase)